MTDGGDELAATDGADITLARVRQALRGLAYGSVTVTVQDGVVVQIDRTEKVRIQRPRPR